MTGTAFFVSIAPLRSCLINLAEFTQSRNPQPCLINLGLSRPKNCYTASFNRTAAILPDQSSLEETKSWMGSIWSFNRTAAILPDQSCYRRSLLRSHAVQKVSIAPLRSCLINRPGDTTDWLIRRFNVSIAPLRSCLINL